MIVQAYRSSDILCKRFSRPPSHVVSQGLTTHHEHDPKLPSVSVSFFKRCSSPINDPTSIFHLLLSRFTTAVSLSAAYDHEMREQDEPLVCVFERFTETAVPAVIPERAWNLLKLFPFRKHASPWKSLKRCSTEYTLAYLSSVARPTDWFSDPSRNVK